VVLIDAPDFTHRIGRRLKKAAPDLTIIKYVAPQVWASRPGRAKSLGSFIDHQLALLPFEPKFFEDYGLKTTFVGHPVVERAKNMVGGAALKEKYGIAKDKLVLGVLPGSRSSEIRFLLPEFRQAVEVLARSHEEIHTLVPAVPHVAERIREGTKDWPTPITLVEGPDEKFATFDAMDIALAASGTVTTELALAAVPSVIGYKVGRLTGFIAQRLVQVPFASLVSIVIDQEIFPEFIQAECTGSNLASALQKLIADPEAQERQKGQMTLALEKMGLGRERPSLRAADAILATIQKT
jgi:lipid-A-disaccharide synthase